MIMYIPILHLMAVLYWILVQVLGRIAPCLIRCIMLGLTLMPSELIMQSDCIPTIYFRSWKAINSHSKMNGSITFLLSLCCIMFLRTKFQII